MISRRTFIAVLAGLVVAQLVGEAQTTGRIAHIGFLETGSLAANANFRKAFRERIRDLGYVEGQNVVFESRGADGNTERLSGLAQAR